MSRISAENLSISYGQKVILDNLSLKVADGQITTIIGANGCGKSTLLRALTRILAPISGQVLLDGQSIAKMPTKEVAKQIALLPQVLDASEGITVYELVSYGRFPHQSGLGRLTEEDREKIDWAMTATNILDYANLPVDGLSGGQRQRVWIAMALAQDTEIIFLDEPTTYLDMNHQLEVLELLQRLNREMNKTIVMVLHDLNLASRFSDQLIAMRAGQIKYQGTVDDIMTADVLRDIFQVQVQLARDPIHDRPILLTYQLLTK
ncbi:ABC transporter ATP-binding protein [Streptococcus merionis]|uniref:ABC transporter ATP-binding protein n=1 Tax=Streptococcus merionis TaxID=400065 RepID=UPI003518419F